MTGREESKWTLKAADAGLLRLQAGYEGGGSIAEGVTYPQGWVFYHQTHPGQTNSQAIDETGVFVAPPASEFCLVCHPAHHWLTVFVPSELLFATTPELEFASSATPQLLKPPSHVTHAYTSLVRRFLDVADGRPQLLSSPAALNEFQREVVRAAQELFLQNQHPTTRHANRWLRQAKSVLALADSDPTSHSIADLARISGVPERTLRTAFQRCYGLSPMEFLRVARLNLARQLLLASCPEQTTVTRIAFELGFWDLGRFAGSYRQLFGELPSQTLRRPIQRIKRA